LPGQVEASLVFLKRLFLFAFILSWNSSLDGCAEDYAWCAWDGLGDLKAEVDDERFMVESARIPSATDCTGKQLEGRTFTVKRKVGLWGSGVSMVHTWCINSGIPSKHSRLQTPSLSDQERVL